MLIDFINVDINLLIFVKRYNIIIKGKETKNKRKS